MSAKSEHINSDAFFIPAQGFLKLLGQGVWPELKELPNPRLLPATLKSRQHCRFVWRLLLSSCEGLLAMFLCLT